MPPINHLNPPPNPFWEFVADMQHHPMFAAEQNNSDRPRQTNTAEGAGTPTGPSNNNQQPQPNVEDPPEVDPATLREQAREGREHPCRGRRRCGSDSNDESDNRREWAGRRGWGRHGRRGWGGPGGWEHGGFPFAGPAGAPFWGRGPHPPPHPPPGFGPGPGFHGRGGHHHRGGPPHHHHPHGRRGPSPPPAPPSGPSGFDLGQFLSDLGTRIGMDLSGAAAGLGLDRFMPSHMNQEVDFEPKVDIFDRPEDYVVHISLPGAKKSDVGVDWDGERYALRVAGVVHRPEVNETMLSQLVVDGRKRETGVFEKIIRLGTRNDPAVIEPAGIRARMADGVLIVNLPKAEKHHAKREVPIAKSQTPSPVREVREKEMSFNADHDHEMQEAGSGEKGEIQLIDLTREEKDASANKGKQAEYEAERKSRDSSATVEAEAPPVEEQLPEYHPVEHHDGSDWENFDSDGEGEFVKINVD